MNNQKILFQYEYTNDAWGHNHTGWLIDSSGKVYCYNLPENWIFCDSLGKISASDMDKNLIETDSICYNIDKKELSLQIKLIEKASKGQISDPVHEMCDAGSFQYNGFIFNPQTKSYKRIILKQLGDIRIDNKSSEADELYKWLDTLDKKIR